MSLRLLAASAALTLCAAPALAADPPAAKMDTAEELLRLLFNKEVILSDAPGLNINDIPLSELLGKLSKRYGLTFVVNEESFRVADRVDIKEAKPNVTATELRGLPLHQFLTVTLDSMGATYIIRGGMIEVVTPEYAAKLAKAEMRQEKDGRKVLAEPLVSAVLKEKPLNEAVALIAERYDLTVVVSPQAGDAKTGFVTARLLNVPADKALELLAVQNDLRVVRKGNAFLITSRDHASELFNEKMDRERAKIELDQLRKAPPPKPGLNGLQLPLQLQLPKPEPKVEPRP